MKRAVNSFFLALVLVFMVGCAGIQPQNLTESLIATETAATTSRQLGQQAAVAGKINRAQAQFIQKQADLVVEGVKAARDLRASNPTAAQNQYQMTADILAALQRFLVDQGINQGAPK